MSHRLDEENRLLLICRRAIDRLRTEAGAENYKRLPAGIAISSVFFVDESALMTPFESLCADIDGGIDSAAFSVAVNVDSFRLVRQLNDSRERVSDDPVAIEAVADAAVVARCSVSKRNGQFVFVLECSQLT